MMAQAIKRLFAWERLKIPNICQKPKRADIKAACGPNWQP